MARAGSARAGRGRGNGHNKAWRNSPLWDSIAKKSVDEPVELKEPEKELDELSEKDRIKRLQQMAY